MELVSKKNNRVFIYILSLIHFLANIIYLTKFPFVHSDESWLSGLSRNILDKGSYSVTETFFDLYPRHPHAIKSIFHSIQMIFIEIFGYKIFSVRLISLVFGMLTLYYFYKLCKLLLNSEKLAFFAVILLSVDVQFIYASHFARQEIVLLFILIFALNHYFRNLNVHSLKNDIILGGIIGLGIGVHPNSFIISLPLGLIYLYHILIMKKLKFKNLLYYVLVVGGFACIFVVISLSFNPNFFHDYISYGEQLGVVEPVTSKLGQIKYFYLKLYYGISGTYYTPNIKLQFFLFGSVFCMTLIKLIFSEDKQREKIIPVILSIIAINTGIILIGRYNQTSVVFQFPLFYILVVYLLQDIEESHRKIVVGILVLSISWSTVKNILPYINNSYNNYLNEISKVVSKDDRVLANLNSEFYFNNGKLYDYRNLGCLKEKEVSFEEYIRKNNIQYIIYPEEMDYIYKETPRWDGLYGRVVDYYVDMLSFFNEDCELVYEFNDKTYGTRIARYVNQKEWKVKIFKVINPHAPVTN